ARYILEGEDTNRQSCWTSSPFWAREFVRAAMECPDSQKSGHRLFTAMMRRLNPDVMRVEDSNLGVRLDSPLYAWHRRAREMSRRFPRLQRLLRPRRGTSVLQPGERLIQRVLERQVERSSAVRACFSAEALRRVTGAGAVDPHALDALLTATCAVERIA